MHATSLYVYACVIFIDMSFLCNYVPIFFIYGLVGWLVGWFYSISTLLGLFNTEVFIFSSNYIVSSNYSLFNNNNHLFANRYIVSSIRIKMVFKQIYLTH